MMSSRWPRPMGIIESMALMPVCSGSLTPWRSTTPGALNSTGRKSVGLDGALAVERAAERVDDAAEEGLADGHLEDRPVRLTRSPSLMSVSSPSSTAPTLSSSRLSARPVTPCGQLEHLHGQRVAQAVDAGDAVADLEDGADLFDLDLGLVVLDLRLQDRGDLFGRSFTPRHLSLLR